MEAIQSPSNSEAFLNWAVECVRSAYKSAPDRPVVISRQDLQMLYVRPIVRYCESSSTVMTAVNREVEESRRDLAHLLDVRAMWDGEYRSLGDALLLGYSGLQNLDNIRRFAEDLDLAAGATTAVLGERFGATLRAVGLRAWWTGPMVLAAALRHTFMEPRYPAHLRRSSLVTLFPSGSRTVETLTPTVTIQLPYDPSMQSKRAYMKGAAEALRKAQRDVESQFMNAGYRPFLVKEYERDAALTFLRVINPRRWSWRALEELLRAEELYQARVNKREVLCRTSRSRVVDAVGRVSDLAEIELPAIGAGRPRGRRNVRTGA